MSKQDDLNAEHISWLVKSRSRNQDATLQLYLIMKEHPEEISSEWEFIDVSQGLTAVCFSLWRAVFLSDINEELEATAADAKAFLRNLILHNMVAYPQDRNTRDWTFLYYVNSARFRLEILAKNWPNILPAPFVDERGRMPMGQKRSGAKDFWTFQESALEVAIQNFQVTLRQRNSSN